jgi:hypothetical protein
MLQNFLKKYHVSTHSGAVAIAFVITTFASSQDFRAACIQLWAALNQAMTPHPFLYLFFFKLGVPLTVTLWGWYRNGQAKTIINADVKPASGDEIISAASKVNVAPMGETPVNK